ncbi:hypothetical protein BDY21DRAFT_100135 [Lineolata rhizophorae]|uniref:Uncharacterized protein n=1 Tax=Lineolata rhizophorae TaxID=578093 RepID=A0A6A6NS96_9PEZI|nr:hypothetical protein BDY21DRAFT_100135 [Lineolata rhizophorae]
MPVLTLGLEPLWDWPYRALATLIAASRLCTVAPGTGHQPCCLSAKDRLSPQPGRAIWAEKEPSAECSEAPDRMWLPPPAFRPGWAMGNEADFHLGPWKRGTDSVRGDRVIARARLQGSLAASIDTLPGGFGDWAQPRTATAREALAMPS